MKSITRKSGIVFILLAVIVTSLMITARIVAAPESQSDTPVHGWNVCEDLGMGSVPGVGDTRQRFRLCNSGWELLTYCLNPLMTAPSVGMQCSRISENRYWCGDSVQEVQFYQMVQTPAPEAQATRTQTPTVTFTPTSPPPTSPPEDQSRGGGEEEQPAPTAQPAPRPQPGGPGNLGYLLAAGLVLLGGSGFSIYRLLGKRN